MHTYITHPHQQKCTTGEKKMTNMHHKRKIRGKNASQKGKKEKHAPQEDISLTQQEDIAPAPRESITPLEKKKK